MRDLPRFREPPRGGSDPFPVLDGVSEQELSGCRARFDACLDFGESAGRALDALAVLEAPGTEVPGAEQLLEVHRILFGERAGSGVLRESELSGAFEGQDCPPPRFIARSLENFEQWLRADSFAEMHPIEQTALTLTRIVDIWPFEFGNRTAAAVFANAFLTRAGHPPFFVLQDQTAEFDRILSAAVGMQTAPLVKTIYQCIEREISRVRQ